MATDWDVLTQQFIKENLRTGISVKAWCEKKKLNYATARRHIKPGAHVAQPSVRKVRSAKRTENSRKPDVPNTDNKQIQSVKEIHEDEVIHNDSAKRSASKKRVLSLGNQNARTFGHYSEFITTDEDALRYSSASMASLRDELCLMRMQLSNLMVAIKKTEADLSADVTVEQRISLNNTYDKFQTNANVKVARIESLEISLVGLEKTKADTEKSIVLTHKAQLEADKLSRESGGSETPLSKIYDEILAMGSDGMLNH
ncbi:MAG: hypothetical protein ACJAZP_002711 [Psychromonas sp.]|jgi:hypothetical protein|uniref:cell division protein DivIVA n=1 Tax=Psychromonas sp. TaxID=1884585 RepID=UPI0039E6E856